MHLKPVLSAAVLAASILAVASHTHAQGLSERIRAVADQKAEAAKNDTSRARLLGALLYTDMSVNFDKTPAKTAFEYIQQNLGVPMIARFAGEGKKVIWTPG